MAFRHGITVTEIPSGMAGGGSPSAPNITSVDPGGSFPEGQAVAGRLTATVPVTWSVIGTDAGKVTLDATTGAWSLEPTNHGVKASYAWTFIATDATGQTDQQPVTIAITDVVSVTLAALTLSASVLAEGAAPGATVGTLQAISSGSTLLLMANAGGRFQLDGTAIQAGPTATDYETGALHQVTVRETHPDAPAPGYRDTTLTIAIGNVAEQPALGALLLSTTSLTSGQLVTINITGATAGSTITVASGALNAGLALNSAARTITGTPTALGKVDFELNEALPDSPTPNRRSPLSLTVTAAAPAPALTLTGPLAYEADAAAGTTVANIGNVPAGSTPTITPNDGRLAVAGNAADGWRVVKGLTASAAGTFNLTAAAAGATSATAAVTVTAAAATGWAMGLARTPAYVPQWTRPATIAAGKANGSIPADAIEFETGNNGGPFSADAAGWAAFMDACNAADKPGAIQTPLPALTGVARKYLYRGLYGAGPQDVLIKRTDRTTGTRTSLWMVWKNKPIIRGIEFDSHAGIIGVTYPRHRLAKVEKVNDVDTWLSHGNPYFTSTEPTQQSFGAVATTFPVGQLGTIILNGNVNITGLSVVYQRATTVDVGQPDPTGPRMTAKILDTDWYAECETVQLFAAGQAACTTHAQVRDAINANSAATGYLAELNDAGQVRLTHDSVTLPRAPDEINAAYSGSGTVSTYNRTPDFDLSHNTLTDCNQGYGAVLDALELGFVTICNNKCPGTWNLLSAPVLRWSGLHAAGNHWSDCMLTRPTAVGRTNSRLPRGSSLTGHNTLLWLGNDSNARMRYHGAMGGNICLIENNQVENVESANDTDTVNAAVLADIRNAWQNTALGRIVRRAYNHVVHLVGVVGPIDCNVFYSKDRGGSYVANYMRDFGAAYYDANRKGSEAAAILKKNPGSYYSTVAGVAAFGIPGNAAAPGGGAEPEPMVYRGNTMIDGPDGTAWVKSDEDGAYTIIEQNLFDGWDNQKAGVDQTGGSTSGLIRVTTHQFGGQVNGNFFIRCNPRSSTKRLINFWNITAVGTHDGARWQVSGNQFQQTDTAYTADTPLVTYNGTTVNSLRSNFRVGTNPILDASEAPTGFKFLLVEDSNAVFNGTPVAQAPLYGSADFLAAYGVDPMPLLAA
jgi:hypothetical protein